jgi:dihydropteroate synthase
MSVKSAGQNTAFSTNKTLNVHGRLLDFITPHVMGILNITPDSFYSGSRVTSENKILKQAEKMLAEVATFLDVGGYSSRPGAGDISIEEELTRSVQAVKIITKEFPQAIVSIDTFRAQVARQAILEGASMINDISAGELDKEMFATVSSLSVPYVAMHMRGTPQTMKSQTEYENLIREVIDYFHKKTAALMQLGVKDIIIDPGFGFAKTIEQNFTLLNHLEYFKIIERPVLVGLSRKSMIWKTLSVKPEEALNGSTALHMAALLKGADILRTHDVREAYETIQLHSKIIQSANR